MSCICCVCLCPSTSFLSLHKLHYGDVKAITFIKDVLHIRLPLDVHMDLCTECSRTLEEFYPFYKKVQQAQHSHKQSNLKIKLETLEHKKDSELLKLSNLETKSNILKIEFVESEAFDQNNVLKCEQFTLNNLKSLHCESDYENEDVLDVPNNQNLSNHKEMAIIDAGTQLTDIQREDTDLGPLSRSQRATELVLKKYKVEEMIRDGEFILDIGQVDEIMSLYFDMKCSLCIGGPIYKSYRELLNHSVEEHKTPPVTRCCDYKVKRKDNMENHILRKHIAAATGVQVKVACQVCKKMMFPQGMRLHLLNHAPLEERKFKCQFCPSAFIVRGALTHHIKLSHGTKGVKCELCNSVLKNEASLRVHTKQLHGPSQEYLCFQCGKSFKRKNNYQEHIKDHKGEAQKVKCSQCDAVVKKSCLARHISRHNPEKTRQCPHCPFKSKNYLSEHIKRVHMKEKKFNCIACPMKFLSERAMKDHVSSRHTGIPEHWCEFCGKAFNSIGNYFSHRKRMHATQMAEKKLERIRNRDCDDIPVYDPEAPKKITAQQAVEAEKLLQELPYNKKQSFYKTYFNK